MSKQDIVIDVDHVTIRFNLANQKIDNLKEYFIKLVKRELLFQEFLAVKDVSFQVRRGEAWGIVGTNGSGKSTLLKAISGILKPYKGSITVRGGVAPLIELGAGFNGELTARENIFLNGCLLGHSEATKVKPDILIVDEILSVGDYKFREKCEKRMAQMLSGGTTLLYVSHSINEVKRLCDHAIWLEKGECVQVGNAESICEAYSNK